MPGIQVVQGHPTDILRTEVRDHPAVDENPGGVPILGREDRADPAVAARTGHEVVDAVPGDVSAKFRQGRYRVTGVETTDVHY
jgi:hypothetical protein